MESMLCPQRQTKYAYAGWLVRDIPLPGILMAPSHGSADGREQVHGASGRRRRLGHGSGNFLGFLKRAGRVNSGLIGCDRRQPLRPCKAGLVEIDPQPAAISFTLAGTCSPAAEHYQIEFLPLLGAIRVLENDLQTFAVGRFLNPGRDGMDIANAALDASPVEIAVELFAGDPRVHAED